MAGNGVTCIHWELGNTAPHMHFFSGHVMWSDIDFDGYLLGASLKRLGESPSPEQCSVSPPAGVSYLHLAYVPTTTRYDGGVSGGVSLPGPLPFYVNLF